MKAGVSIGSNLGNRLKNLSQACDLLCELSTDQKVVAASIYETDPVDCAPGTPSFLNTVVEIKTDLSPRSLLDQLQLFEQSLGRPSDHARNAPRTIDLDLLYCGDVVMKEPTLTLPHPRLHERRFVLQPLAEIRSELVIPGLGKTVTQLLAALGEAQPTKLAAKGW
ncbi:MAG: 2-amino-4-hydroxy-6-hydroxymethyldihydropteridine diphosphokinase [Verrucomicrobia bacterium GWF2_62_7]|nr:MAG: 2-amino-4-hydroxy-6-hydroxymethyldihydropteridine diphosphokinase [Verrucomicrobia bacterium GWF2_62_7]